LSSIPASSSPPSAAKAALAAVYSNYSTKIYFQWRPQLRDADDELVLEAAINGLADALVTHNVRDFLPAANNFGIQVITPGHIIKERFTR
jgi:predicted nucleic acid-binding protein